MKKALLIIPILALFSLFLTLPSEAAVAPAPIATCTPILNGGPTCQQSDLVQINKKVLSPKVAMTNGATFTDSDFVENVTQSDTRYTPNTPTAFRLYVTNKTNRDLKDVVVSDVFPQNFLTFVTGNGSFDTDTHTFTTKLSLKPKESKTITIQVLTATTDEIIKNNAPLCTINVATAVVNKKMSQDNSMLCVDLGENAPSQTSGGFPNSQSQQEVKQNPALTKGGLPVASPIPQGQMKKAPSTGPEMLVLAGLLPAGLLGHFLRKKSL